MQMNLRTLRTRCNSKISDFWKLGKTVKTKDGNYCYIDRGKSVLAVAHLDTVNNYDHFYHLILGKEHYVYSTALDDRLGAYIILDLLPKLVGYEFDVLLTEGEEHGKSTGYYFEASHDYNWMFQFDRAGDDVVMYQYESDANSELLKDYGFRVGVGSFTDISSMDFLNVSGFNFGTGYYDNHSVKSYADLDVTETNIRKFVKFFKANKDILIPAPPLNEQTGWGSNRYWKKGYTNSGLDSYWNTRSYESTSANFRSYDIGDCVNCGAYNVDTDEDGLCETCAAVYDNYTANTGYKITKAYQKCSNCGKWNVLDDYGICDKCNKDYEDSIKKELGIE